MPFLLLYMHSRKVYRQKILKKGKKMYTLKPFFYNDFYSIGSECPYTCCGGWLIDVDKESRGEYEKYEGLLGYDEERDMYVIQFNGNHMCPLCDEEQLCKLYKAKGEGAFCHACRTFPRSEFIAKEVKECYLSLGCPYVVSFFKERQEPLSFILEEDGKGNNEQIINSEEEKRVVNALYKEIDMDLNIRNSILDLLQNREWPLWFRQFASAYCLDRIKEVHSQGNAEEVGAMLEKILAPQFMTVLMQQLKSIPKDKERSFYLLNQIAIEFEDIIAQMTFFGKEGGNGTKAAELLNRNRNISFEEYKAAEDRWESKEKDKFEILMEHVASYNWMQYALMGFTKYYMMDNYWDVLLEQMLVKHFSILHYSIYNRMEWNATEFIISFICRTISHGRGTMKEKLKDFKEKELLTVANLYMLI